MQEMSRSHTFLPVGLFGGIALLLTLDLVSDWDAGHLGLHFAMEAAAGLLALVGVALFARHAWEMHRAAIDLSRDLRAAEAQAQTWRAEAQQALEGLATAIDREFAKWGLTEAEREIALMLLKGFAHREIAAHRHTTEGTVRQQALTIYRKAGLTGRSSLAAFFFEGLALPGNVDRRR
jgi:DNA-binding CsgD family transcriptional regulator